MMDRSDNQKICKILTSDNLTKAILRAVEQHSDTMLGLIFAHINLELMDKNIICSGTAEIYESIPNALKITLTSRMYMLKITRIILTYEIYTAVDPVKAVQVCVEELLLSLLNYMQRRVLECDTV